LAALALIIGVLAPTLGRWFESDPGSHPNTSLRA